MNKEQLAELRKGAEKATPEPWRLGTPPPNGEQTIGDNKGFMVAVATTGYGVDTQANARRIVACVNACAGIPTEELESFVVNGFDRAIADRIQVEKQRDDLLAALELIANTDPIDAALDPQRATRATIASVKESK